MNPFSGWCTCLSAPSSTITVVRATRLRAPGCSPGACAVICDRCDFVLTHRTDCFSRPGAPFGVFRRAVATPVVNYGQDPASVPFRTAPLNVLPTAQCSPASPTTPRYTHGCLVKSRVGFASRPLLLLRSQLLVQQQTWMSRACSLSAGLMAKVLFTSGVDFDGSSSSLPGTGVVTDRVPLSPASPVLAPAHQHACHRRCCASLPLRL